MFILSQKYLSANPIVGQFFQNKKPLEAFLLQAV
jgi:hypothetical protein